MNYRIIQKGPFEMFGVYGLINQDMQTAFTETTLSVPSLTWAIFPEPRCELPKLWERIYSEWFPTSDYEQVEGLVSKCITEWLVTKLKLPRFGYQLGRNNYARS